MSAPTDLPDARPTLDDLVRHVAATEDEAARQQLLLDHLDAFDHDLLFTRLKDESEHYRPHDAPASLRLADGLIFAADRAGRPDHRAMGVMARGDALRFTGRFAEGLAALEEAGAAFLALGDEIGWARTRLGWIVVSMQLGRGEAALAVVNRARDILVRAGMWVRVGILEMNAGIVCRNLGRYEQALTYYERARQTFEGLGKAGEVQATWAKMNTAIAYTYLGDLQSAVRLHQELRQTWQERGDTIMVGRQDHNLGFVYAGQGHYTRALRSYTAAAAIMGEAGQHLDAAWNDLNRAECYLSLNMIDQALALSDAAAGAFARYGTPTETARAQFLRALILARGGDTPQALAILDDVAATFQQTGLGTESALTLLERAILALRSADWPSAATAAATAQALLGERGLPVRRAQASLILARATLVLGDGARAAQFAASALEAAQERGVSWLIPECHTVLGHIARGRGDLAGALGEYAEAMGGIEQWQRALAIDLRANFLDDKHEVYDAAVATSLQLGEPAQAFASLERGKSRVLVDYLANTLDVQIKARSQADREDLDALARLRAEHNWFYTQLYRDTLTSKPGEDHTPIGEAELRAAIAERERQIGRLVERLALERTEGLDLVPVLDPEQYAPPADLGPDTVLLEYALQPDLNAAFVVVAGQVAVVPLATTGGQLQRLVRGWRLHLETAAQALVRGESLAPLRRSAETILGALYRALIAPVAPYLRDCARLIVVPYGPAHAVPFHALHDGERYLLERGEVVVSPASGVLRLCRERARRAAQDTATPTALIVAHSNGGALPFVLDEALAVTAALEGEQYVEEAATRGALIAAAARHRILHLAAHGEARLDNPTLAHLQLADGQLSTIDIFNLDLRGALVVLSACETGRSVITESDELIGLSRGFLYAGASTLVQSLWRVEDRATARLMAHFYRALGQGSPKAQALRRAQLHLLREEEAHPFIWAPFQFIGDWRAL